jgi:hypothetical protein
MQICILVSVVMLSVTMLNVVVPISFIIVGVNEKVGQFVMALKSIYNKKFLYWNKKIFLNAAQRLNQ